jgi:hypothetical protein
MSGPPFGVLQPSWLLGKLFHDFKRLQADEGQPTIMLYTAFDFFVTGYSLAIGLRIGTQGPPKLRRKCLALSYAPL